MSAASHVLVFSGQASQFVGMGKDLASEFKEFDLTLEEASDHLGFSIKTLMFEDPLQQLNLTEFTQPAVLTMSTALARVLRERAGVVPHLVAGHSLGEYSALVALGALRFADAVKAVRFRGQAMQKAVPVGVGAMAAYLGSQSEAVVEICRAESQPDDVVEPVNFNSPSQLVLSGHKAAVERVSKLISERKLGKARLLPVSAPFHSALMRPAAEAMHAYLQQVEIQPFEGTIVANVDAQPYESGKYTHDVLVKQVAGAVLWTQSVQALHARNPEARWIEVGPGAVLQSLVRQTLAGVEPLTTGTVDHIKTTLGRF